MADSIVMQLSMAGGGVSLIYSELIYSYTNLNDYDINVQISDFNTTNWKCLIVYHPILISPFIAFRPWFDANSDKNYNNWIQGITLSGTTKNLCILMMANNYISITNQTTLMVFS